MKKIFILFLLFVCVVSKSQTESNYPKPFGIKYGSTKSQVIEKMKNLGYKRSTRYSGLIFENIKFIGYVNSNISFDFNRFGRMMSAEIFVSFDDESSAYTAQYKITESIKSKYNNLSFKSSIDCSPPYKKDGIKIGEIISGVSENKIKYYDTLISVDENVEVVVELTFNSCVRVEFKNKKMKKENEQFNDKANLKDI